MVDLAAPGIVVSQQVQAINDPLRYFYEAIAMVGDVANGVFEWNPKFLVTHESPRDLMPNKEQLQSFSSCSAGRIVNNVYAIANLSRPRLGP
jgi:hypothetical protein